MPSPQPLIFYQVVESLSTSHIPLENLIRHSLVEPQTKNSEYVDNFVEDLPRLLGWLAHHERTREAVKGWMKQEYTSILSTQLRNLSRAENGFHINAGSMTAEKIKNCTIQNISQGVQAHAPDVWELCGKLLEADPIIIRKREKKRERREKEREKNKGLRKRKIRGEEDEDEQQISQLVDDNDDEPEDLEEQLVNHRLSLSRIVGALFTLRNRNNHQ
jgi:hypothetical protein